VSSVETCLLDGTAALRDVNDSSQHDLQHFSVAPASAADGDKFNFCLDGDSRQYLSSEVLLVRGKTLLLIFELSNPVYCKLLSGNSATSYNGVHFLNYTENLQ